MEVVEEEVVKEKIRRTFSAYDTALYLSNTITLVANIQEVKDFYSHSVRGL
jgi:hypothetical protein